jgi:hypothetical protein
VRTSNRVLVAGAALALVALAATSCQRRERRDFSAPTTMAMGRVLHSGGLGSSSRFKDNDLWCWVSYEFTPTAGSVERNWRFWSPGCGVSRGNPLLIQYVVGKPELNRPAGDAGPSSLPVLLLWFAAGVAIVVAIIMRNAPADESSD